MFTLTLDIINWDPVILFVGLFLCGPLAVLVPSIIADVLTPFSHGDSSWWFIGPVLYGYGLLVMLGISIVLFIISLVGSWSFFSIAITVISILEIIVFSTSCVLEGIGMIRDRREFQEAVEESR